MKHHCHLEKVISSAIAMELSSQPSSDTQIEFGREYDWVGLPATVAILRFTETPICRSCNEIDGLLLASKPGPHFSLSPEELGRIRKLAGHSDNKGSLFDAALRQVRVEATADYRARYTKAASLGQQYGRTWLAAMLERAASGRHVDPC